MSHHILKINKLGSPEEIEEFFKNLGELSGEVVEQVKSGQISKNEIGLYLAEFQEIISLLENLKSKI